LAQKGSQLKAEVELCALVPYPVGTTPSQRYRIEQWVPYLEKRGIGVDIIPFADEQMLDLLRKPGHYLSKGLGIASVFFERGRELRLLRRYDAILVHRAISIAGPAILERLLALVGCPIIYDFDDAIFLLHTSAANKELGWFKFPGKTATICRLSSHVVVGNTFLRDYALQFNDHVTVVPTSVDTDQFKPVARTNSTDKIVVGWTGSSTSQTYLEAFLPMLRLVTAIPSVELRIHSDRSPNLPGVPFKWREWLAATEVDEIGQFDVGLMPMPDDDWARGKCAMKALLYMSLGIPAVCSAVGANLEVISHGGNGFLATSDEEWASIVRGLVESRELRQEIGVAGRRTIEERYSMRRSAELFANVVNEVVGQARSREDVSQWQAKKYRSDGR
jgi:glycosyltransferase involved in cell wall biosynthesis